MAVQPSHEPQGPAGWSVALETIGQLFRAPHSPSSFLSAPHSPAHGTGGMFRDDTTPPPQSAPTPLLSCKPSLGFHCPHQHPVCWPVGALIPAKGHHCQTCTRLLLSYLLFPRSESPRFGLSLDLFNQLAPGEVEVEGAPLASKVRLVTLS